MAITKTKPDRCPICKRTKEIAVNEQVHAMVQCEPSDCIFKLEIIEAINSGNTKKVENILKQYFIEFKVGVKDIGILVFKTINISKTNLFFSNCTHPEFSKPINNYKLQITVLSMLLDNTIWKKESGYDVLLIKSTTSNIYYKDKKYNEFKLFFRDEPVSPTIDLKNHIIDLLKVLQQNALK